MSKFIFFLKSVEFRKSRILMRLATYVPTKVTADLITQHHTPLLTRTRDGEQREPRDRPHRGRAWRRAGCAEAQGAWGA